MKRYTIIGLIIGVLIGVAAAFGELTSFKKSMKDTALPILIVGNCIGFGFAGARIGYNIQKDEDEMAALGLNNIEDSLLKDGRYWVGISKWTHPTTGKEYTLLTARSNQKIIVSALNDEVIINHQVEGANQNTIPKLHQAAKVQVIKQFKEHGEWKA